jgi:hypothetical protein
MPSPRCWGYYLCKPRLSKGSCQAVPNLLQDLVAANVTRAEDGSITCDVLASESIDCGDYSCWVMAARNIPEGEKAPVQQKYGLLSKLKSDWEQQYFASEPQVEEYGELFNRIVVHRKQQALQFVKDFLERHKDPFDQITCTGGGFSYRCNEELFKAIKLVLKPALRDEQHEVVLVEIRELK